MFINAARLNCRMFGRTFRRLLYRSMRQRTQPLAKRGDTPGVTSHTVSAVESGGTSSSTQERSRHCQSRNPKMSLGIWVGLELDLIPGMYFGSRSTGHGEGNLTGNTLLIGKPSETRTAGWGCQRIMEKSDRLGEWPFWNHRWCPSQ